MLRQVFIYISACVTALVLLSKCETPADPQNVSKPSRIKPQIYLQSLRNFANDSMTSKITVKLKDENDDYVEVSGGKVTVNGVKLLPPSSSFQGPDTRYYKSTTPVLPDSVYTFRVTFSDGDYGYAWIETADFIVKELNIPLEHRHDTPMTISWKAKDFRYPQHVYIQYWTKEHGFSSNDQVKINVDNPFAGQITIDKKYFPQRDKSDEKDNETRIILIAATEGLIEDSFMSGGYIESQIRVYRDIFVY